MKRGPKPKTPSELRAAGTFRRDRHGSVVEIEAGRDIPQQPEWLTEAGRQAWSELIEHVVAARSATAADASMLGTLCNLLGASALCWASGAVPPAAHLAETRRLAEMFRVAGPASRLGAPSAPAGENPFLALLRGPDRER